MNDPTVITPDQMTAAELQQAQEASRAAMREIGAGGISLSKLSVATGTVAQDAVRLRDNNLTADVAKDVVVGVVGFEEVKAAEEVAQRVGQGGMKKAIAEARKKAIRDIERRRDAEMAIARTPRNHAERRALRLNPNWSRDGSYAATLPPSKPKGTKSPKPKRRKKGKR